MQNGRHLPDNMRLREVIELDIPARLRLIQLVWEHEHLTVGDVRRMSDARLLWYPNIGRKCAARIREFFGKEQALSSANIAEIPDVITELRQRIETLERRLNALATDDEGFLVA